MEKAAKIHNEVYDLLMQHRENDASCYFTFRRSNRANRLQEGYWFYGDEYYLAVSFWSGMDWKSRTPNISFVILIDSGETYLEVRTSDSDLKRSFVVQYLIDPLLLEPAGLRYRKLYQANGSDYLSSLAAFLETDKRLIDRIIGESGASFFASHDELIGFIPGKDFEEQLEKVSIYKAEQNKGASDESPAGSVKPDRIEKFKIENFGPIKEVEMEAISFSTQWIFFTGENGTGKTSILRALATALCFRRTTEEDTTADHPFRVSLSLFGPKEVGTDFERIENTNTERNGALTSGFAAYGQSRLRIDHIMAMMENVQVNSSDDILYSSLFSNDSSLLDLQRQFDKWQADPFLSRAYEKRKLYITEILTDIIPNLYNIDFNDRKGDVPITSYIEKDYDGGAFKKVTFEQLASGLKSMIAMIGDIMVRLYDQQPTVFDPAEFTGIVLIDEIDIHLHPKLQKELVEQLTRTFPKIQFIASTHSPISLLGAPKNSRIFKVERSAEQGVSIQRLDDKLILGDLLPNTILTSPIFGLDDIIPNSHDARSVVRTETKYADVEFNDEVKRKINEFVTDEKEQQLIDLFKSRKT
jgi:predicted ATPase